MNFPRIMLAGASSGSGKTTITCGVLLLLQKMGFSPAAFKCGPDYIDPMFHAEITGAKTANLDLFFTGEEMLRSLMLEGALGCGIGVLEGVMGYYDGLGGKTDTASAYHLSKVTKTPAILIVDAKGASLSLCALINGFLGFREDSHIKAVFLNRCSKAQYELIKPLIEDECRLEVIGYLPQDRRFALESRHLGLVTAKEVANIRQKLEALARTLSETMDIKKLIELAAKAPDLEAKPLDIQPVAEKAPIIALAKDKAFCFYYRENLELLERLGARLRFFSPLEDERLPQGTSALYLGGGYPELYGKELSENRGLLAEIKGAGEKGLPILAECGGFMYLHSEMRDKDDRPWPLAGLIDAGCYFTGSLRRFGYSKLLAKNDNLLCKKGEGIAAHEFHYFESESPGESFLAKKPLREKSWDCIHGSKNLFAGFPHIYFYANPNFAKNFVKAAEEFGGMAK